MKAYIVALLAALVCALLAAMDVAFFVSTGSVFALACAAFCGLCAIANVLMAIGSLP